MRELPEPDPPLGTPVENLSGIGGVSAAWLHAAGIHTRSDLERMGAARAWLEVWKAGFRPTRNLLWALQGAIMDLDWRLVPDAVREQIDGEVNTLTDQRGAAR